MKSYLVLLLLLIVSIASFASQRIIVAADGTGDFVTVQKAIDAVPENKNQTTVIFIKSGLYKEKLVLPSNKSDIHLVGENVATTKLTFDDFASKKDSSGKELGTARTASCYIYGADFTAENITFENAAGPVGQALAVWVGSDRSIFINCRFLGFQDTIYTDYRSRQYYKNCYIEGTTDFIFGPGTAVFEDCEIFCKKGGYYITAASTPDSVKYGYVFINCRLTGDAPAASFYLGRPWRPFAKVVYMRCTLGPQIRTEGWNNWGKESNEKTAYYAEYKNKGASNPSGRVSWSHQLTDVEAKQYTLTNIFSGWTPKVH
jgi:pectinesterase